MPLFEATSAKKMITDYQRYLAELLAVRSTSGPNDRMIRQPFTLRLKQHTSLTLSRLIALLNLELTNAPIDGISVANLILDLHKITSMDPGEFLPENMPEATLDNFPNYENDAEIPAEHLLPIALCYYHGITVKADRLRAFELFKKAGRLSEEVFAESVHTARYFKLKMQIENYTTTVDPALASQIEKTILSRQKAWRRHRTLDKTLGFFAEAFNLTMQVLGKAPSVIAFFGIILFPLLFMASMIFLGIKYRKLDEHEKPLLSQVSSAFSHRETNLKGMMNPRVAAYSHLTNEIEKFPDNTRYKALLRSSQNDFRNHVSIYAGLSYPLLPFDFGVIHKTFSFEKLTPTPIAGTVMIRPGESSNKALAQVKQAANYGLLLSPFGGLDQVDYIFPFSHYLQEHADREPNTQKFPPRFETHSMEKYRKFPTKELYLRNMALVHDYHHWIQPNSLHILAQPRHNGRKIKTPLDWLLSGKRAAYHQTLLTQAEQTESLPAAPEGFASLEEHVLSLTPIELTGSPRNIQLFHENLRTKRDSKAQYHYLFCALSSYAEACADTNAWQNMFLATLKEELAQRDETFTDEMHALKESAIKKIARHIRSNFNLSKKERFERINSLLELEETLEFEAGAQELKAQRVDLLKATIEWLVFLANSTTNSRMIAAEIEKNTWAIDAIKELARDPGSNRLNKEEKKEALIEIYQLKAKVLQSQTETYLEEKRVAQEKFVNQSTEGEANLSREDALNIVKEKAVDLLRKYIDFYSDIFNIGFVDAPAKPDIDISDITVETLLAADESQDLAEWVYPVKTEYQHILGENAEDNHLSFMMGLFLSDALTGGEETLRVMEETVGQKKTTAREGSKENPQRAGTAGPQANNPARLFASREVPPASGVIDALPPNALAGSHSETSSFD